MFSALGTVSGLRTSLTVVGVMLMESSQWVIGNSSLTNGYRTGSAGVREIRTREVTVEGNEIARQASGIELIDVRAGKFRNNRITENGTAWTWGRDNTGTTIQNNVHRGNLLDFAGDEPSEQVLMGPDSSHHGAMQPPPSTIPAEKITVEATELHIRPQFDHNEWDGWSGTDLDQDGIGDTPYRFDIKSAVRSATRPWAGIFLGSPWSQWSQGIPGGEVIDEHPRARPER
jgi:nitrous oxidase accessory protein NosD